MCILQRVYLCFPVCESPVASSQRDDPVPSESVPVPPEVPGDASCGASHTVLVANAAGHMGKVSTAEDQGECLTV